RRAFITSWRGPVGTQSGRFAKRGISPDTATHGSASSRKISRPAFATVGSSNVPTFRMMTSGLVPGSSEIDEPHSGQKCLRIGLPLPPMLVNVFKMASTESASLGTRTSTAKALPVNFWQSRQWHTVALVGSVSAVYLTAPQRQPPLISISTPLLSYPLGSKLKERCHTWCSPGDQDQLRGQPHGAD